MRSQPLLASTLALVLVQGLGATPASAQTTDDFFNPNVLRRLDIVIHGLDWEKLKANFQTNTYYPCDIRWQGITTRNVGVRSRGFGSRSGTKPGLRVDMNRYAADQTFLGLKSFALDNLGQDASGVKELIAMKFYARLGLPAPRVASVQLYINNSYAGLYSLIESIDKAFLKRVYGEHNGDTENDGYLFEYDWQGPWGFDYLGSNLDVYAQKFSAKTHENDSVFDKYYPVEQWVRAANQSSDARFVQAVSPYIDLPMFVKTVAAEIFLSEFDGLLGDFGMANFYLYRFEGTTRHQFIPWDADRTFHSLEMPIFMHHADNILMKRAMRDPALRETFLRSLLEAVTLAGEVDAQAASSGKGWLEQEIDAALARVQSSVAADPYKSFSNEDFVNDAEWLRNFARRRGVIVRCAVARESSLATLGPECS
jgi:spore coat protein CotH